MKEEINDEAINGQQYFNIYLIAGAIITCFIYLL
jgi:hypothetical protein